MGTFDGIGGPELYSYRGERELGDGDTEPRWEERGQSADVGVL